MQVFFKETLYYLKRHSMLSLEELQEVFDEMRIGTVVINMKEKDITEQQIDLKNAVLDNGRTKDDDSVLENGNKPKDHK